MTVFTPFIYLSFILLALFIRPYLTKKIINYPLVLAVIGFLTATIIVVTGHTHLIHYGYFQNLIRYFIIPVVIYHSAMSLDYQTLKQHKWHVILLGFVLSLTTVVFGGYLIYLIIGKANQFSMVAGILTMAILVSTTVTTIKDYIPKAKTVYAVLQAESLCTQIISLVCFTGIVTISLNTTAIGSMFSFSLATFANLIAGGLFIALMVGGLTIGLINVNRDIVFQSVATLFAIYLGYLLSMSIFKASGAIVVAGMAILFTIIGDWLEKPPTHIFIDEMWESLYAICYAATYLLFGATVTIWMFTQQYLVMAAAIVIIFGLRAIICYFTLPKGEKNLYFLGGVRGILPIVLTLGLPSSLPYWWTIQSIVCGVVLFSLVIQLPVLWMNVRGEIA